MINTNYCTPDPNSNNGCQFGLAYKTLANSLGILSPLYQMGGSRSMQFSLKLVYTGELVVNRELDSGIRLLEKPFTRVDLLKTIDAALG